jgi:hypothetical protein
MAAGLKGLIQLTPVEDASDDCRAVDA